MGVSGARSWRSIVVLLVHCLLIRLFSQPMFIDHPVPDIWETAAKETEGSSGLQVDLEEERGKAVLLMGDIMGVTLGECG